MVAGDLRQASALAIEIGATIANVDDVCLHIQHEGSRQGCSQVVALLFTVLADGSVRPLDPANHHIGQKLFRQFVAGYDILQHRVRHTLDRDPAGLLPAIVAAHAVGHHKEAKGDQPPMIGTRSLHHHQAIFIRRVSPLTPNMPANAHL